MQFSVGYQANPQLKHAILNHLDRVHEVYFPWAGFASGRGFASEEAQRQMETDLDELVHAGLAANLLLNGNCYGRYSQSRVFFQKIGDTVDALVERYTLSSVTTASPIIAKFLKTNFPSLEIRASVNMEIGTDFGMEYLLNHFDAFYAKRELNQDWARLKRLSQWAREHGKKLYLLANSGCLNFCSVHNFHDNLVAHEREISEMDNAFEFHGLCHEWVKREGCAKTLLAHSNFIRPEDVSRYEEVCDGMKLATRTTKFPGMVVDAYCEGRFHGNLLELTEPSFAAHFYPNVLANGNFPEDYAEKRLHCDKQCDSCGYCQNVMKQTLLKLD
ncbi:MAG: hypothetical protein IJJ26_06385 [Victivallales bacterium]|nr:hypothetical protein [Victivallales bacterium]